MLDRLIGLTCAAIGQTTSRRTGALVPACIATYEIASVMQIGFSSMGRVPDGTRGGPFKTHRLYGRSPSVFGEAYNHFSQLFAKFLVSLCRPVYLARTGAHIAVVGSVT